MAEKKEDDKKKTLSLGKGTLSLKGGSAGGSGNAGLVQQSFSGGRSKAVAVEVRRSKRAGPGEKAPESPATQDGGADSHLSEEERQARQKALELAREEAEKREAEKEKRRKEAEEFSNLQSEDLKKRQEEEERRQKEAEEAERIAKEQAEKAEKLDPRAAEEQKLKEIEASRVAEQQAKQEQASNKFAAHKATHGREDDDSESYRDRIKKAAETKKPAKPRGGFDDRKGGKLTVAQVLNQDYERDRGPSMAARKRALQKERMKAQGPIEPAKKQVREVILPEAITVQELSNRMAEKATNVIKELMKMGIMATVNQSIDADTAELIIGEFGHTAKRVTEGDIELGIRGEDDRAEDLISRAPVVTIMGHVDHGKTSLLDALRQTDVVSGEAGGITQHIGAYQVTVPSGKKITFLDTPGHAAFTQMRARGADVTDIVVLVVSANDSIMPQTIEAIAHAKAANVPLIVAINKIDLPDANPNKVKQDLLQHEVVVEDMGGETLCVEISAKQKINLDGLEEAILLQAEMLDLKSNPERKAEAFVVETKMEKGRGSVATVLIQRGTLNKGDIFVTGSEWGRVRVMNNDHGKPIKEAIPGMPVEVLGLHGTPEAGDDFVVVDSEAKAREIAEYRLRKKKEQASILTNKASNMDALFAQANADGSRSLAVIIKADVHGSVEAIAGSLQKITEENDDVRVNVIHSGVGGITESDVTLARASNAIIIGFNVRANAQARDLANMENVRMQYYSIIYDAIDDIKNILGGMLEPTIREEYIGNAEIREVFNITKVGKIAGCYVTNGYVKRGSKVRLLRDDVVIHEGMLKTLKRFKDEVKEVKEGTECGMAFENYDDLKAGDIIECFDLISEKQEIV
jgi:translation initiation factor IF-2